MKGVGKIDVILGWNDNNYSCRFQRGRNMEDWNDMTREEQVRAIGAMVSMAEMFGKFIKEAE